MNRQAKEEIRQLLQPRYRKANKVTKHKLLDEFCALCGYHRKYAIVLLKQPIRRKKKTKQKAGRKACYQDKAVLSVLQRLWQDMDFMCSARLKATLPLWLPHYTQHYGALAPEIEHKLATISTATIDRVLKPLRNSMRIKRRCQTRPGTLLKKQIPYKLDIAWEPYVPGFLEADTVSHGGASVSGDYAWSLTLTDIHTTWTGNRAVWNKGASDVLDQIRDIELSLPFPLLAFNCDGGSEFLNKYLIGYLTYLQQDKLPSFRFSRSRPGKKNDNTHVEQKNWTHVRHLFGYHRLGRYGVVDLMNDLYKNEWRLYQNFFMPTMKLVSKQRIGSRYRKTLDKPQTPYQRVLGEAAIPKATKEALTTLYKTLNPFALKEQIQLKLQRILNFVR